MGETSGRIRVLHAVDQLALGGMERMAVEIASLLDPTEFDVTLCATRAGGPMARELGEDIPLVVLNRASRWDPSGIWRFSKLVRARRVEVVHSHGRGTAKLVCLCRATGLISAKHVFHDHFGGIEVDRRVERALRAATRVAVDSYIGVSQTLCDWAVDCLGVPRDRVTLIANGIDTRRFDVAAGRTSGPDMTVAVVAGLRETKDHPTLLRALASSDWRERLKVKLIGPDYDDGYSRRCHAMVDDLGLGAQVTFVGPRTDVADLLADADIGVLSSVSESGPLALLEYMAAGLPYVVTETGEFAREVKPSDAGYVVPPRDPEALRVALDRVVAMSADERRAMGARGRVLAVERFDQRMAAERVAAIYRSLARPRLDLDRA